VRHRAPGRTARLFIILTLLSAACSTTRDQLQQHQKKLQSLASTADAIGHAWLDGSVSGAYARTALDQTFVLVEQERRGLTSTPQMAADPAGGRLADAADHLARVVALVRQQVAAADAGGVRQHLGELPMRPANRR
jgi:16S rRNA G1207 methylase RsmC